MCRLGLLTHSSAKQASVQESDDKVAGGGGREGPSSFKQGFEKGDVVLCKPYLPQVCLLLGPPVPGRTGLRIDDEDGLKRVL